MYHPPDPLSFNTLVWEIVRQIPEGRVSTYGQIASMIPLPDGVDPVQYKRLSARWVGSAMRTCPDDAPWQRVINSKGMISLPRGSPAADEQRALLEMEGVIFDVQGYVDFELVGWTGPDDAWLHANGLLPPRPLVRPSSTDETQLKLF